MKLLADTHVTIWFFEGDRRLSKYHRSLIEDKSNEVLLSFASLWEIAIKVSLKKLTLSVPFQKLIEVEIPRSNFSISSLVPKHLFELQHLPFHHNDPFDRLIIAQSIAEDIPIITSDPKFKLYDVNLV
jgi:PIN domain nuclease of toxin-antitoxin system